tara:strand:- start:653 stop:802 length:150 start_codon:yes stop_codon:yes gene_type:complete
MVLKKKDLDRVLLFDIQRPFFRQKSIFYTRRSFSFVFVVLAMTYEPAHV